MSGKASTPFLPIVSLSNAIGLQPFAGDGCGLRETTHVWQMRMWPWLKLPRAPVWETSQSLPKKKESFLV